MTEDAVARLAQALAHPVRLRILELLRDQGAYVMHLTNMLDRPQANISQHLAVLRDAGLVTDEREGMTVVYRVRDERIYQVQECLAALVPHAVTDRGKRKAMSFRGHRNGYGARNGVRRGCRCPRCRGC